jgi:hypothetical protein
MTARTLIVVIAALAALGASGLAGAVAPASGAVVRKFEGEVISVKRSDRSFLMHDRRRGRNYRIYVRRRTRYESLPRRFSSLRRELEIEVLAARSPGGRLLARKLERD